MKRTMQWGALALLTIITPGLAAAGTVEKLKLGETKVLANYIGGDCNAPAPSFQAIKDYLPDSKLVTYSDGGVGPFESKRCGGTIEGRQVLATGVEAGTEIRTFQASRIGVKVY
ncbi:hypothetical protein FGG78_00885 [Thioclava sp. BHET1]|uniref:Uncharacterized protein n=1 Tax=Thioclava dalianensis TaxID=1185766 RepID=A0A074U3G6_9RHOB|nr:hypothetical protein [Thioclava dalianensis]KEP69182.1 hypothetical protein DL1_05430 [Thioclava dalianensis]TMV94716.1 hypothetical protein FGG78_00885 [Thioclava sp. BHET1]SFM91630.1 hypothetical protein SAMN05216224_101897 [Thioclava dalianensis]